ncbi:MAG: hypothetical protein TR69_WS6001000562 [candidate division WS6 bacterium OLB20]|uniref:Cna protein B-type domain protein n=1 Tax=candidate division WS6 bacterium OLB20 TaxID=1617426 RepID=A0A136LY60_9BACT|nr:MAG: hypothetical protein TR69_WS6001000562 [candidate division WS6 bacterium OLB20]
MGLMFLTSVVSAQVNINSKTEDSDSQFFELSDTDQLVSNTGGEFTPGDTTPTPTTPPINQLPDTGTQVDSNIPVVRTFQEQIVTIEERLINSETTPEFIKNIVTTLGLPTATAVGFSLAFLPAILTLIPLILSPQLLFLLLGAVFGEQKNVWGIVMDSKTKKAVPFAVVRLFEQNSTAQITQKVSDLEGRYGFVLSEGKYRIEVSQSGYTTFKKDITIASDEELFTEDIMLEKETYDSPLKAITRAFSDIKALTFKYSIYLVIIGFVFSVLSLIIQSSFISQLLFLFYLGTLLLYVYIRFRKNRTWGVILDSQTGLRISGATIRLFDPQNSLADTQLSDTQGRFGFLADPGQYSLLVSASGYSFPSQKQKDLHKNDDNKKLLDVHVKKPKWLNLAILLDPGESDSDAEQPAASVKAPSQPSNLLSPFAG